MSEKRYEIDGSKKTWLVRSREQFVELKAESEQNFSRIEHEIRIENFDHKNKLGQSSSRGKRNSYWLNFDKKNRLISWPGGQLKLAMSEVWDVDESSGGKLRPLKSTMPGKVIDIKVKVGDIVSAGDCLLIIEAMKMENNISAPADAKVKKVPVAQNDILDSGATLIEFEAIE